MANEERLAALISIDEPAGDLVGSVRAHVARGGIVDIQPAHLDDNVIVLVADVEVWLPEHGAARTAFCTPDVRRLSRTNCSKDTASKASAASRSEPGCSSSVLRTRWGERLSTVERTRDPNPALGLVGLVAERLDVGVARDRGSPRASRAPTRGRRVL